MATVVKYLSYRKNSLMLASIIISGLIIIIAYHHAIPTTATPQPVIYTNYTPNPNTLPTSLSNQYWDLSQNTLDLVTGELTITLIDNHASKDIVLVTAQALSTQLLEQNADSGIQTITFLISSNDTQYRYHSEQSDTLQERLN